MKTTFVIVNLTLLASSFADAEQSKMPVWEKLQQADFPLAAALSAREEIYKLKTPSGNDGRSGDKKSGDTSTDQMWKYLRKFSVRPSGTYVLTGIASATLDRWRTVPQLGSDWNYYRGVAFTQADKKSDAIAEMEKIKLGDRFFTHGLYLRGILLQESKKTKDAVAALNAVLMPETQSQSRLQPEDLRRIIVQTHLALARIFYRQKKFMRAIRHYREVERDSPSFYRALHEQAWALFLEGYVPYSLGSLYGVQSPFYSYMYNPEAPLLEAINTYWVCNFSFSKRALKNFNDAYNLYAQSLKDYAARLRFTPEQGYTLLEDYLRGVSSQALGIDRRLLGNVAYRDHIRLLRGYYADVVEEQARIRQLDRQGEDLMNTARRLLDSAAKDLRNSLGAFFVQGLRDQAKEFESLRDQADFLEIEMLVGEKDQILGQKQVGLEAKQLTERNLSTWARKEQSWATDYLNEYWWDEVGFHLIPVVDQCVN